MRALVVLATALILSGCSMAASSLLEQSAHGPACDSTAGAYNLSKSYIALAIHEGEAGKGDFYISNPFAKNDAKDKSGIAVVVKPDGNHPYCLDYLASPTSDDTFTVQKNRHLLEKITTIADDKSVEIAQKLIQALFVGLSGNADFDRNLRSGGRPQLGSTLRFQGEFDPFDMKEVARVNDAINDFGFCIFIQGHPVDPQYDNINAYCENPRSYKGRSGWATATYSGSSQLGYGGSYKAAYYEEDAHPEAPTAYSQGIFYRPRLPHTYYLYVKDMFAGKGHAGTWKLRGTATLLIENIAPIFNVGVDRTYFAKRETTLTFKSGVLQDVQITKDSELAGFVAIPLQISQSIAALPANIIQIKINDTNNREKLIAAQADLIEAERQLAEARNPGSTAPAADSLVSNRSSTGWRAFTRSATHGGGANSPRASFSPDAELGQCFDQCLRSPNGSEPVCNNFCTCKQTECGDGDETACINYCRRQLN